MCAEPTAVVVGGGPAGATAAAVIAQAGLPVTLLAAGGSSCWVETVPAAMARLLAELGLPPAALPTVGGPCRWQGGDRIGLHIDRASLDPLLRCLAHRAGASIHVTRAVSLVSGSGRVTGVRTACGESVPCGVVIDASGSRAWLARQIGLHTRSLSPSLIAWRGETRRSPDGIADEAARFQVYQDGWLFDATWRGRTMWTAMGRGRRPPRFAPAIAPDRAAAHSVGWRLARPVAAPGWLLAGEAAGRLDPAWGEGLTSAILSGMAAGRAAVACLTDPAREALYLASYDGWFADRIYAAAAGLRQRYAENGIHLIAEPAAVV